MYPRTARATIWFMALAILLIVCRKGDEITTVDNSSPKYADRYVELEHLYDIDVTQISLFSKGHNYDSDHVIDFDADHNMYVLDEYQSKITVFDEEGKFIKEFGHPGQGPNEFFMPDTILIRKGHLYVFHGRMGGQYKVLDLNGNYISENIGVIENRQKIKSIGNDFYVMRGEIQRTLSNLFFVLTIEDETLSRKKEVFRIRHQYGLIGPNYEFIWSKWLLISSDGYFYYPEDNFHKYSIIKYDKMGNRMLKFGRPSTPAPYSSAAKKRFYDLYRKEVERKLLSFPANPPFIVNMFQDETGHIWVVSGETHEDNLDPRYENTIDIFNAKGQWLSSFHTKLISKQTLYHAGRIYRVLPLNTETYIQMIEVYRIKYLI